MKQPETAREELALIEKRFFKGAGLAKACQLKGEERRAYRLAQVNRLLTEKYVSLPLAVYLSDMFWTADEGRVQLPNPIRLLSLRERQTLTDRELSKLWLIFEVAGLCHDLYLNFTFDLNDAFGIRKNDFRVKNKQLVEWLTTTEYERVAMHTAYIMKKCTIIEYAGLHYLPAQDELARLYSAQHKHPLGYPHNTEIPPRDYVSAILDSLLAIERHWQRGRRLKLDPEVVILHDEIYGVVPRIYNKEVLKAAQELHDYLDTEVFKSASDMALEGFAAKVREVRSKYLAKGWVDDGSLEFTYLMEHAQRCLQDA